MQSLDNNPSLVEILPTDMLREVWQLLPRTAQSQFLETSKKTYNLAYDSNIWEFKACVKRHFEKSYNEGSKKTFESLVSHLIGAASFLGVSYCDDFKNLPTLAANGAVIYLVLKVCAYIERHSEGHAVEFGTMVLGGGTGYSALVFLNLIPYLDGSPLLISSATRIASLYSFIAGLIASIELKGNKRDEIIKKNLLALAFAAYSGLFVYQTSYLSLNAALIAGVSGAALPQVHQISNYETIRKVSCGILGGIQEAVSWSWNIGMPKLKNSCLSFYC